jgi:hypothetical protein
LFSCYTGLSYSDVMFLSSDDVSIGIDGEKWIFVKRTKTDTASRIPLLPIAKMIIEKYSNHPQTVGNITNSFSQALLFSFFNEFFGFPYCINRTN